MLRAVYAQEPPEIPKIKYIRLNTGEVEIAWDSSATPGIDFYTVWYKYQGLNEFPDWDRATFDTIWAGEPLYVKFYPELNNANALEEPVAFAIQANKNGKENLVDDYKSVWNETWNWDSSMVLTGEYDTCLSQMVLNWTPYDFNAWGGGALTDYQINIIENGIDTTRIPLMDVSQVSYTYTQLNPNSVYGVYVSARSLLAGGESTSNLINFNTNQTLVPDYIFADYATYSDGNVELQFTIDPIGELTRYEILRASKLDGDYELIAEVTPEQAVVNYIDHVNYGSGPFYYILQAINKCEIVARKSLNTASSIVLEALGDPKNPNLIWNGYSNWVNGVSHYDIERKLGEGEYTLVHAANITNYTDDGLEQLAGEGMPARVCYKVVAHEHNNGFGRDASSQSNDICLELPVNVNFTFDAFTPGNSLGNNTFGPTIDFLPDEFEFCVLNRAGAVVFRSTDATNPRWDGRYNGQLVPQGAYMYVCQYRIGNGKRKTIRGGVAVVYQ